MKEMKISNKRILYKLENKVNLYFRLATMEQDKLKKRELLDEYIKARKQYQVQKELAA